MSGNGTEQQLELLPSTVDQSSESTRKTDEELDQEYHDLYLNMEPLNAIADGRQVRIPKNPHFSRQDVVNAFQASFELVGGIPRLALWANENYDQFAKLYGKLVPASSAPFSGENNNQTIILNIKPSALDD